MKAQIPTAIWKEKNCYALPADLASNAHCANWLYLAIHSITFTKVSKGPNILNILANIFTYGMGPLDRTIGLSPNRPGGQMLLALLLLISSPLHAEQVRSYFKKNGAYVESHERSTPNAYRWDNYGYTPSQPAYNKSYHQPTKNYGSGWYQPNPGRFSDPNPYNDYAPPAYNPKPLQFTAPDTIQPTQYNMSDAVDSAFRQAATQTELRRLDAQIEMLKKDQHEKRVAIIDAFDDVLKRYPTEDEIRATLQYMNSDGITDLELRELLKEMPEYKDGTVEKRRKWYR